VREARCEMLIALGVIARPAHPPRLVRMARFFFFMLSHGKLGSNSVPKPRPPPRHARRKPVGEAYGQVLDVRFG